MAAGHEFQSIELNKNEICVHDTGGSPPATSLRQTYDCRVRHKKCRTILNHVLKRCDNRSRNR